MNEIAFKNGEIIFKEGDMSGRTMYRLLQGKVGVFAHYGEPEEQKLTELAPGAYLGEMAVIEASCPRSATAVALEEGTKLAVIDGDRLYEYLNEGDEELFGIFRHLSSRLRELSGDYEEVCGTLHELGRLDTRGEKVSEGLLNKLKKFAAVYLLNQKVAEEASAEAVRELRHDTDAEAVRSESYRKGTVIFRAGEAGKCLYDIRQGRVGIYANYGESAQKQLAVLDSGCFFGEMGLLERLPRSATAVAMDDGTRVELIYEQDLKELLDHRPARVLLILQHLSHRLRVLTKDYLMACKALAEAREKLEAEDWTMTPEERARLEYLTALMLMPEVLY